MGDPQPNSGVRSRMSTVDSLPSRSKFVSSQVSARSRPNRIRQVRLSQSALSLLRALSSAITSAAAIPVYQHSLQRTVANLAVIDQLDDEGDRAHLTHQRGIEADLVDAVHDLARRRRQPRPLERIDMNDHGVAALATINQRKDRRIAHVAAIPVVLACDGAGRLDSFRGE